MYRNLSRLRQRGSDGMKGQSGKITVQKTAETMINAFPFKMFGKIFFRSFHPQPLIYLAQYLIKLLNYSIQVQRIVFRFSEGQFRFAADFFTKFPAFFRRSRVREQGGDQHCPAGCQWTPGLPDTQNRLNCLYYDETNPIIAYHIYQDNQRFRQCIIV